MMRSLFAIAAAAVVAGCQTYDFEPVQPLAIGQTKQTKKVVAHQLKPNLMMLLDQSGSMQTNTSTASPCPATIGGCGPGNLCPAGCNTRITDMQNAMDNLLTNAGATARYGVAAFPAPGGNSCGPTTANEVMVPLLGPALADDDSQLQAQADAVNTAIKAINPGGGTPTADSLRFVGGLSELQDGDRQNFVLLLTDGVPNCNGNNPNSCTSMTSALCQCTTGTCTQMSGLCSLGCLDADASVDAVKELANKNIRTIVIGFGADTAQATAFNTLNQMALAGQFARPCPHGTDAECGAGDHCNVDASNLGNSKCNQAFFQAANQADLKTALDQISAAIGGNSICQYTLDQAPSDPRYLSVTVDGQSLQRCADGTDPMNPMGCNTWVYDNSGVPTVTFVGSTCDKVKGATQQNPVQVEFRIVTRL